MTSDTSINDVLSSDNAPWVQKLSLFIAMSLTLKTLSGTDYF